MKFNLTVRPLSGASIYFSLDDPLGFILCHTIEVSSGQLLGQTLDISRAVPYTQR